MSPVLVSGERIVLVLSGYTTIDGQALLEDVGRLPDGKRVVFTLPTPDGVSFTLVDADSQYSLQYPGSPFVGPAGLVVTAISTATGPPGIGGGLPQGRVARDGYELRYNEPEGGLTLWDLTEDTAVYVFGPEDMRIETPPGGVRQINDGQLVGLVFEDPETGADLVTFTGEDLASLVGMTAEELEAASSGNPEWPEEWVGWSADGTAWGWESLADAFGIDDDRIWTEFAVGRDFVIAPVATFQVLDPADSASETSESQDGQVLPTRWFIAKVP